jgi:hypothetical protein
MNRLFCWAAERAGQPFGRATHLKVDTPKRGVKVNLFDLPGRHLAQYAGGQTLDAKTYTTLDSNNSTAPSEHPHSELLLDSIVNVVFHTKRRGSKLCTSIEGRWITKIQGVFSKLSQHK